MKLIVYHENIISKNFKEDLYRFIEAIKGKH